MTEGSDKFSSGVRQVESLVEALPTSRSFKLEEYGYSDFHIFEVNLKQQDTVVDGLVGYGGGFGFFMPVEAIPFVREIKNLESEKGFDGLLFSKLLKSFSGEEELSFKLEKDGLVVGSKRGKKLESKGKVPYNSVVKSMTPDVFWKEDLLKLLFSYNLRSLVSFEGLKDLFSLCNQVVLFIPEEKWGPDMAGIYFDLGQRKIIGTDGYVICCLSIPDTVNFRLRAEKEEKETGGDKTQGRRFKKKTITDFDGEICLRLSVKFFSFLFSVCSAWDMEKMDVLFPITGNKEYDKTILVFDFGGNRFLYSTREFSTSLVGVDGEDVVIRSEGVQRNLALQDFKKVGLLSKEQVSLLEAVLSRVGLFDIRATDLVKLSIEKDIMKVGFFDLFEKDREDSGRFWYDKLNFECIDNGLDKPVSFLLRRKYLVNTLQVASKYESALVVWASLDYTKIGFSNEDQSWLIVISVCEG
jgi:hypothetical protein